jgi:phage repressor protein C with HTH and peptisase S24 domain
VTMAKRTAAERRRVDPRFRDANADEIQLVKSFETPQEKYWTKYPFDLMLPSFRPEDHLQLDPSEPAIAGRAVVVAVKWGGKSVGGYVLVGRLVRKERHRLIMQYDQPRGKKSIVISRRDVAYIHTVVASYRSELNERQPAA